ncbi:uncharacterized protein EKO05_0002481 [Ascochyta rabiei]|uniref:uncharacterized protein n=1 Tax=Didymella rabiei TaxID=5454 RepID=UPI001901A770|nr:uncharacterized protein EKO05_0002481 [Ascochyta rabiei]UPX11897.1 hypothetical protein EKO05_0002481 [Ascochyta rabiei]
MAQVSGTCGARFTAVKALLESKLAAGEELGASLVVDMGGEKVVDLWGGYADVEKTKPWGEDTITNVWSSSKTVISLAALLLIDRQLLDPYEKVSKYWPEFGGNGKEDVEVRHVLSHSSGVSGWEGDITMADMYDLETSTARLAAQEPWWTPGTASGYHSLTMGHLLSELCSRTTGKPLARFVADELTTPLGADFSFGVAKSEYHRVADLVPPPAPPAPPADQTPDPTSVFARTLLNPPMDARVAAEDAWRAATVFAANGHTNARGLAKILAPVSCHGTVGDTKLLRPETVDLIFREQTLGPDLVLGARTRFGIGYGLNGAGPGGAGWWLPEGKICFWGGWGGSVAIMDVGRGVTITYAMNKMVSQGLGSGLAKDYVWEVYRALGVAIPEETA